MHQPTFCSFYAICASLHPYIRVVPCRAVPCRANQEYSDAQKAEVWVKVAEAYLESDETDAADNFCNKVHEDLVCCLSTSFLIVAAAGPAAAAAATAVDLAALRISARPLLKLLLVFSPPPLLSFLFLNIFCLIFYLYCNIAMPLWAGVHGDAGRDRHGPAASLPHHGRAHPGRPQKIPRCFCAILRAQPCAGVHVCLFRSAVPTLRFR